MGAVAAIQRRFHDGSFVMIDVGRTGAFMEKDWRSQDNWRRLGRLELQFGQIIGACASTDKNDFEYTVRVEEACTECVEEEHIADIFLPELHWVSKDTREVAVWIENHGERRFVADLLRRDAEQCFEVRFVADSTVLKDVPAAHLSAPNELTLRGASPDTLAPDPLWLLDRKIQANVDARWPMRFRIREALRQLQKPRPASTPPLCGPFVGRDLFDSEGYPAHPAPLPELSVGTIFEDTWGKFKGKLRFATTYKMGPSYPRNDTWIDRVDAGEPLYFHAALPVHAGLVCLGSFPPTQGQPEWVRASDVALVGVALYVQGELRPGFPDPPLVQHGLQKFGHEACHFIPGCVSTYKADCAWVGSMFCLAPNENDWEVRDDIYSIHAYHQLLAEVARRPAERGAYGTRHIKLEVNLVLSTNYLANVRQVCSGAVKIGLTPHGLKVAQERLQHVLDVRLDSPAAQHPQRGRKVLAEAQEHPVHGGRAPSPREAEAVPGPAPAPEAPAPAPAPLARDRGSVARPPPPSGPRVGPFGGARLSG